MGRLTMILASALTLVAALQVSHSAADETPVNSASSKWQQLPMGCTVRAATDESASGNYETCQKDSGFTFENTSTVIIPENAFCMSNGCLGMMRTLDANRALPCLAVPSLQGLKLETFEGRYACFGNAGNDLSVNVIVRPPKTTTSGGSTGSVSETAVPSGANAAVVNGTTAPGSAAETKTKKNVNWMTIVLISSVGTILVGVAAGYVFVKYQTKKNRLTVSKPQSAYTEYDPRLSTVPIIEEISTPQGNHYDDVAMLSNHWKSGAKGFGTGIGSVFAGWDEESITAVRIPYEKLEFGTLISRGGYGEVYRGTYRGNMVAIKALLPERRRDMRQIQSFVAEIKMMAAMEHERIVKFIGVAWDSLEELSVVIEFLAGGDLRSVLTGFEADESRVRGFDATKIKIAMHIAHALTYLHTLQPIVVHRDLKSRNILLDEELNAKLTDFGVSRERADQTMTAGVGSSLWMAPEVMMGERYDEKADVFSFGVVLGELDSHTLPYAHATESGTGRRLPDTVILQMVSLGKIRAAFTDEEQSAMAQIGLRCVALKPEDRPTTGELLHLIHQVSKQYSL